MLRISKPLERRIETWLVSLGTEAHPVWDAWLTNSRGNTSLAVDALHAAGDAGFALLRKHFADVRGPRSLMLTKWIGAGYIPDFAQTYAVEQFAHGEMDREAARLVVVMAAMEEDRAPELATALDKVKFHWNAWGALSSHGGALGRRVGRRWFTAHGPKVSSEGFGKDGRRATEALGGVGGADFHEAPGGLLVGLRYTHGMVNWRPALHSIQGLYWHAGKVTPGKLHGRAGSQAGEVMSRPGYAIGGLYVQHGERLQGFAVVYMRHTGELLDPKDAYIDTWHGGAIVGQSEACIGGQGHAIVGLHGRAGAVIDALGLIEQAAPSVASAPR